jgi:shikimate kinase
MTARHLVLVGLMGAGKTTVGERCAEYLERDLVDTDDLVVATAGMTVTEIFEQLGEARFRELEREAVRDVCGCPVPLVIACGGGVVVDPVNRERLRASGFVVWLRASTSTLSDRVGDGSTRPLLRDAPMATLDRLATQREPAYVGVADSVIDTDGRSVEAVTVAVLDEFKSCSQ